MEKPFALPAQQVFLGHDAVCEDNLRRGGAVEAHLLLVLAHGEAGVGALHDEGGDALGTLGLVGHGKDHEHVGHVAVGDEDLGAVQHPVVPLQPGLGLALGGVGAGVGLGEGEGPHMVAGGEHGQVLLLLLLGAVLEDGAAAQAVVGGHDVAGGGALLGQLLDGDGPGQVVGPGPAVRLGDDHAHDAQVEELLDGLPGISRGLVGLGGDGLHLGLGKFPHHLADQLLLTGQFEFHLVPSYLFISAGRAPWARLGKYGCPSASGPWRSWA